MAVSVRKKIFYHRKLNLQKRLISFSAEILLLLISLFLVRDDRANKPTAKWIIYVWQMYVFCDIECTASKIVII